MTARPLTAPCVAADTMLVLEISRFTFLPRCCSCSECGDFSTNTQTVVTSHSKEAYWANLLCDHRFLLHCGPPCGWFDVKAQRIPYIKAWDQDVRFGSRCAQCNQLLLSIPRCDLCLFPLKTSAVKYEACYLYNRLQSISLMWFNTQPLVHMSGFLIIYMCSQQNNSLTNQGSGYFYQSVALFFKRQIWMAKNQKKIIHQLLSNDSSFQSYTKVSNKKPKTGQAKKSKQ